MEALKRVEERIKNSQIIARRGRIKRVVGIVCESRGPHCTVGELCRIHTTQRQIMAEAVGFTDEHVLLMPLGEMQGVAPGCVVEALGRDVSIGVSDELLGRVVDGLGNPIDGKGPIEVAEYRSLEAQPPSPLARRPIEQIISTGVRAIDGVLTCGKGQRIGIFAGSGVGKSMLLGMIARYTSADVNVIALVGERGREVRLFIERDLGEEALRRSVVVAVTSDQPALLRLKAAFTASAIAEYFRDKGLDVMLLLDSITRVAMAQREVGLAAGEVPATRGYTPSVYAMLPRLLERSGMAACGSITAFYTVLVEGDDMNEPVADMVRSILDGHIVLSRSLAQRGHYPAIDVLASLSRVMVDIVPREHFKLANRVREVLATYREAEDLINIGAYVKGSNPRVDYALEIIDKVNDYLRQDIGEPSNYEEALQLLRGLFEK